MTMTRTPTNARTANALDALTTEQRSALAPAAPPGTSPLSGVVLCGPA